MSNQQVDLWKGAFGDDYQKRNLLNDDEINARIPFWKGILQLCYMNCNGVMPSSVLEIGAGQGPNMLALEKLSLEIRTPLKLLATEINDKARDALQQNVKSLEVLNDIPSTSCADLSFTYGVLIHTHPAHLRNLQDKIYKSSKRWIMCAEYFAPETRPISYRGEREALWLDDYGAKWLDNFPLRLLGYGFCWKRTTKLDNITFWLFEKTEKMI
jgi:pseudaminic acid biosynthesis-associated methylase